MEASQVLVFYASKSELPLEGEELNTRNRPANQRETCLQPRVLAGKHSDICKEPSAAKSSSTSAARILSVKSTRASSQCVVP